MATANRDGAAASGCPVDHSKMSGCPHAAGAAVNNHPMLPSQPPTQLACDSSAMQQPPLPSMKGQCPVDHSQWKGPSPHNHSASSSSSASAASIVGDVFPDSNPSPQQRAPLNSLPVASRIPKGGADVPDGSTWVFPSPQRFYNAMTKKGWSPREEDMAWIVSIHNTVNEQTWARVMEYERMHEKACSQPKLVRFRGRPGDLSPKARIMSWFGYVAPFDRHDWVVDRCGKEVRYVIDFYSGSGNDLSAQIPGMPPAIHLDVRPALTPSGAFDRIRMQIKKWMA